MDAASFLKIVSNVDVEKKLNNIFRPVIELAVNELLKPIKQQLDTCLNEIAASVNMLKADLSSRNKISKLWRWPT
jgi:hypothetical protein